ncbi:MAG: CBS domain-containing protein [Porticoccaceae bacterium]|nr:CBS domain-containing protein [Porticoccaceae bacterium]
MPDYSVREVMQRNPIFGRCGQPVVEVVETMARHKVMGMPVVDKDGHVVGFISEQDCIQSMLATSYFCEGNPVVDDVMSHTPLTVSPGESVVDLARRMGRDKPKVYPVVEEGKLVGLITRSDILNVLRKEVLACSTEGRH